MEQNLELQRTPTKEPLAPKQRVLIAVPNLLVTWAFVAISVLISRELSSQKDLHSVQEDPVGQIEEFKSQEYHQRIFHRTLRSNLHCTECVANKCQKQCS